MHKSHSPDQKRFILLDMYADSGQDSNPEAWRKHGLHTYSATDTALMLDISLSTLRRWRLAKKRPLPVRRKGKWRYRFSDIYSYLAEEAKQVGYTPQPFSEFANFKKWRDEARTSVTVTRCQNKIENPEAG